MMSSGSKSPLSARLSARQSIISVASVISPGRDVVDAAADHLGDDAVLLDDLLGGEELGRRAQRLAGGEAEQRAPEAVAEDVAGDGAGFTRAGPSRAARRRAPGR